MEKIEIGFWFIGSFDLMHNKHFIMEFKQIIVKTQVTKFLSQFVRKAEPLLPTVDKKIPPLKEVVVMF